MNDRMYSPPALTPNEGDGPEPGWENDAVPHRPIAGNTADDDGIALDQMFEAMDAGPQIYGIPDTKYDQLHETNRILSRTLPLQVGVPLLFFPADPRRTLLRITGTGATTVIRFASSHNGCYSAARVIASNATTTATVHDFVGYTGPVWIMNDGAADLAADLINVFAITK